MITIRKIRPDDWQAVKALRLEALADAPYAFAETLAEAKATPDSVWQNRVQQNAEGKSSIGVLASENNRLVGMAVGLCNPDGNQKAHLVAMWVSPDHRGTGAAESLVQYIVNWARESGSTALVAGVTEHNPRAQAFYRRLGFEVLPNRPPWKPEPTSNEIPLQMIIEKQEREQGAAPEPLTRPGEP